MAIKALIIKAREHGAKKKKKEKKKNKIKAGQRVPCATSGS